jgi:hypothetical protein
MKEDLRQRALKTNHRVYRRPARQRVEGGREQCALRGAGQSKAAAEPPHALADFTGARNVNIQTVPWNNQRLGGAVVAVAHHDVLRPEDQVAACANTEIQARSAQHHAANSSSLRIPSSRSAASCRI